jgi:acetyltransferase
MTSSSYCGDTVKQEAKIDDLFKPRSVAVIGASTDPSKIGHRIVANMVASGYKGRILPVNPKGGEILGHRVYSDIREVEDKVDLAMIAIPARFVLDAVKRCGDKGVKHLIIITSGFSEVGNAEEEKAIVHVAHKQGMRVLGPNIFGIYSSVAHLDATFGPGGILPGHVAIVTQSGALGIAMIGKTAAESLGLSALVSVGNKSDTDESDLLHYLAHDDETRIILLYIEGVKHGDRLVKTLKEVTPRKPVIVIKSGRSKRGAVAAASHTGSLAGADEIFDSVMRQCGVLRAESVQEAFYWAQFLADAPSPPGKDAVIITNGGGIGVLATDACEKYGVDLYDNPPELKKAFAATMPDFGSAKNPVDLTGQATVEDYARSLKVARTKDNLHAVIALYCETALFDTDAFAKLLQEEYARYCDKKPIVFSLFGGDKIETIIRTLRAQGMPVFSDVYDAVSCLGALYRAWRYTGEPREVAEDLRIDTKTVETVLGEARRQKRGFLLAPEAKQIADLLGIDMPQSILTRNLEEAVEAAERIGYPVGMKVVSKDIIHKSDAGGVALDLENAGEVIDAYQAITRSCHAFKPDAFIEGVEVVEMAHPGVETIVGARQDPSFGPIVMFGLGGIYVEVMKDVSFRAAPITRKEAHDMVAEIRSYPLLLGVRGEKRKHIEGITEIAVKLSHLIALCRDITDIEINPLVVYEHGKGVKALDIRILFRNPREVK